MAAVTEDGPSAFDRTVNPTAARRYADATRDGTHVHPCGCTDNTDHESDCRAAITGYPRFYGDAAWAYHRDEETA